MNGPQHYTEAQRLLDVAHYFRAEVFDQQAAEHAVAKAQVHATLALVAATASVGTVRAGFQPLEWAAAMDPDDPMVKALRRQK